ncbi:MAG: hypothetical protein C0467_24610, partial [Planctomycetaceae bacterium]|nr:hypothetical protein [Planctomycetaceae bacterium]
GLTKTLLLRQIAMLASQEVAILTKAGIAEPTAVAALAAVDVSAEPAPAPVSNSTHRRDGRRFLRVAPGTKRDLNGTTETREGHDDE